MGIDKQYEPRNIRELPKVAAPVSATQPVGHFRYYDLVLAGFVAVLLCSNLIGTAKVSELTLPIVGGVFVFGVGNIFFPISYIFGDVLTEVYGYARARRVIWAGFLAMIFASTMAFVVVNLPVSPTEPFNATLHKGGPVDRWISRRPRSSGRLWRR